MRTHTSVDVSHHHRHKMAEFQAAAKRLFQSSGWKWAWRSFLHCPFLITAALFPVFRIEAVVFYFLMLKKVIKCIILGSDYFVFLNLFTATTWSDRLTDSSFHRSCRLWGNPTTPAASAASSAVRAWTAFPSLWTRRTRSTASETTTGLSLRPRPLVHYYWSDLGLGTIGKNFNIIIFKTIDNDYVTIKKQVLFTQS